MTANTSAVLEIWCKINAAWNSYSFEVLSETQSSSRVTNRWTLYNTLTDGSQAALPTGYTVAYSTLGTIKNNTSGNAGTATKLGTANKGSATQPIYLSGGTPTACTYTLGKSVPTDAKFTDTTYSAATQSTAGLMSASDKKKLDSGYVVKSDDGGLYVEI